MKSLTITNLHKYAELTATSRIVILMLGVLMAVTSLMYQPMFDKQARKGRTEWMKRAPKSKRKEACYE